MRRDDAALTAEFLGVGAAGPALLAFDLVDVLLARRALTQDWDLAVNVWSVVALVGTGSAGGVLVWLGRHRIR